MTWKGFVTESKLYMGYPTQEEELNEYYNSDLVNGKSCRQRKIEFYLRSPRSWLRFQWYGLTARAVDMAYAVLNFIVQRSTPRNQRRAH